MAELTNSQSGRTTSSNLRSVGGSSQTHLRHTIGRIARPRIGQLLIEAGIVKPHSFHQALNAAKASKKQVGETLVGLGVIAERELNSVLLAQSLITEGAVTERAAIKAVRLAAVRKVNVADIIHEISEDSSAANDDGGLGSLLVGASVITSTAFEQAFEKSHQSGMFLGRTLLLMQAVTAGMLDIALRVLVMQREGQITKEQAVRLVREVRRSHSSLDDALMTLRIRVQTPMNRARLGEILALSKLITESENAVAVERALLEKKLLGEILVNSGFIDAPVLDDALVLQVLVSRGVIAAAQAGEVLSRAYAQGKSMRETATELSVFNEQLALGGQILAMLKQANLISNQDITIAMLEYEDFQMPACKALLASGRLAPSVYNACVQCIDMIDRQLLKNAQALVALDVCNRTRCDLPTALANIGAVPQEAPVVRKKATTKERCHTTVADWLSYPEFKQLLWLMAVLSVIEVIVYEFVHVESAQMMAGFVGVIILSIGLMRLGDSWRRSREKRDEDRVVHLELAKETKTRLKKFADR